MPLVTMVTRSVLTVKLERVLVLVLVQVLELELVQLAVRPTNCLLVVTMVTRPTVVPSKEALMLVALILTPTVTTAVVLSPHTL